MCGGACCVKRMCCVCVRVSALHEHVSVLCCVCVFGRDQDGTLYDGFERNDEQRCSPDVYEWVSNVLSHSKTTWMFRAREHELHRAEKDVDGELVIQLAEKLDGMPHGSTWSTLQHHVCLLLTRLSCPAWRTKVEEGDGSLGIAPENKQ